MDPYTTRISKFSVTDNRLTITVTVEVATGTPLLAAVLGHDASATYHVERFHEWRGWILDPKVPNVSTAGLRRTADHAALSALVWDHPVLSLVAPTFGVPDTRPVPADEGLPLDDRGVPVDYDMAGHDRPSTPITELVQVIAMAAAWVDAIDAGGER